MGRGSQHTSCATLCTAPLGHSKRSARVGIWPEVDGFDDFFVGLVHYNLLRAPKCKAPVPHRY